MRKTIDAPKPSSFLDQVLNDPIIVRLRFLVDAQKRVAAFISDKPHVMFGNVIIEAQASGLPVIVSDAGGPKELVTENENGLITKSHDAEDLARAIRQLVVDPTSRQAMGCRARESVADRTWPAAFQKFWALTDV